MNTINVTSVEFWNVPGTNGENKFVVINGTHYAGRAHINSIGVTWEFPVAGGKPAPAEYFNDKAAAVNYITDRAKFVEISAEAVNRTMPVGTGQGLTKLTVAERVVYNPSGHEAETYVQQLYEAYEHNGRSDYANDRYRQVFSLEKIENAVREAGDDLGHSDNKDTDLIMRVGDYVLYLTYEPGEFGRLTALTHIEEYDEMAAHDEMVAEEEAA